MTVKRGPNGLEIYYDCFLCTFPFRFGPSQYDGKGIGAWDIQVCNGCYRGNHDGIVPASHLRLMQHLKDRGITVRLNARGWLDWPE